MELSVSITRFRLNLLKVFTVHRDPRYFFPDPNAFWPERWLPKEGPQLSKARGQEFKLNLGAYIPFNYGAHSGSCFPRWD
jgi:cytochrome P450